MEDAQKEYVNNNAGVNNEKVKENLTYPGNGKTFKILIHRKNFLDSIDSFVYLMQSNKYQLLEQKLQRELKVCGKWDNITPEKYKQELFTFDSFIKNIVSNSKDLEGEIVDMVNNNFWELIYKP